MTPQVHGFQKRMALVWEFGDLEPDFEVSVDRVYAVIEELHTWMWKNQYPNAQDLCLDACALTVYLAVKRAIAAVLEERKKNLGEAFKSKLKFAHSDIIEGCSQGVSVPTVLCLCIWRLRGGPVGLATPRQFLCRGNYYRCTAVASAGARPLRFLSVLPRCAEPERRWGSSAAQFH